MLSHSKLQSLDVTLQSQIVRLGYFTASKIVEPRYDVTVANRMGYVTAFKIVEPRYNVTVANSQVTLFYRIQNFRAQGSPKYNVTVKIVSSRYKTILFNLLKAQNTVCLIKQFPSVVFPRRRYKFTSKDYLILEGSPYLTFRNRQRELGIA